MSNDVKITIQAIDKASKKLQGVNKELDTLDKTASNNTKTFSKNDKAIQGFSSSLSKIGAVAGITTSVFLVLKKAFDMTKEGAELEYTEVKFERLAESIGTTSDALLTDLHKATSRMFTDAQLMKSAGDMMSLGLATTSDEAVRLARITGALDMNMNQLTLTLTNKTTMRFDSLGVAVAGFDEKLQALKDSGMDTDAAFKEAFLQQAEAQIDKVGSVADETVGALDRISAWFTQHGDDTKMAMADFFSPAIFSVEAILGTSMVQQEIEQKVADRKSALSRDAKNYEEYVRGILRIESIAEGRGGVVDEQYTQRVIGGQSHGFSGVSEDMFEGMQIGLAMEADGQREAADAAKEHSDALAQVALEMEKQSELSELIAKSGRSLQKMTDDYDSSLSDLNEQLETAKNLQGDNSEEIEGLTSKINELKEAHKKQTSEFVLGILIQKGATADQQVAFSLAAGLIDQNTADIISGLSDLTDAQNDGALSMGEYEQATSDLINEMMLADGTTIDIFVNQIITNSGDDQIGGGYIIDPDGGGGGTGMSLTLPPSIDGKPMGTNENIASAVASSPVNVYGSVTIQVQDVSPEWLEAIR